MGERAETLARRFEQAKPGVRARHRTVFRLGMAGDVRGPVGVIQPDVTVADESKRVDGGRRCLRQLSMRRRPCNE